MFGLKKNFVADDLSEALTLFGYHGITADISYPRLQSVVSALAGQLFWSGKFETADLGQERLILPDVNCGQPLWRERQIVGLTGESGVGKTTIANFLKNNYNFTPAMSRWVTPAGVGKKFWPDVYNYMGPRKIIVDCLLGLREVACWKSCFGPSFAHVEVMRTSQEHEQKIVNNTRNKTKANAGYYGDAFSVRPDLSINNKYKISNLEELLSVIFDNDLLSLA
jgi:hypothetical protein